MYTVCSLTVFILVFSGNYVQKTYAATEDLPPCELVKKFMYKDYLCQGLFQCNHNVTPPACCPREKPLLEDGGNCRKSKKGDPCTESYHCENEDCDTSMGRCRHPPDEQKFGEGCFIGFTCDVKEHLACTEKRCICEEGFEWNQTACVKNRVPKKTITAGCETNKDCDKKRQLKCINQKCDCEPGFSWTEAICKAKSELPTCDPSVFPNECPHDSKQMECDKDQLVCRCPQDMEFSPSMKACKLKAGEYCMFNGTREHDRCASQQCGSETDSSDNNCACHHQNGITQIWSSGQGCVTDYFGLTCSGSHSECRLATFNTNRDGLICKDNICQCDEGLTYLRGYCVVANLTFGDRCDPEGIRPTCKTDADLTCRDVGYGLYGGVALADFRCACLLREVPVRGTRRTFFLNWNGTQKKCGLKSHGEWCRGDFDCRSGVCKFNCIGEYPGDRSTGATIYVYDTKVYNNYVFLIILFSVIVTHF